VNRHSADVVFRSLADPARRQVARIVAETPLTVGEISGILGLPQSTVSRHLKSLRTAGLVVDRREGARVFIALSEPSQGPGGVADELGQALNAWLRQQPLPGPVGTRLVRAIEKRERGEDAFGGLAERWDEMRREHFGGTFHLEALASLLPSHWRVLDAGTGTGYLLPFLGRHFRRVTAADSSPAMLELARARAGRAGLGNVDFRLGRLEELPLGDASIDCAIALLVLRHSSDPERAIRELSRVLVEGGRLVIVDVAPHTMEDFRERIGDASWGLDPVSVAELLARAGFGVPLSCPLPLPEAEGPGRPTRPAPDLFLISATRSGAAARTSPNTSHISEENS
jgi:ArsR family transcriptional regulator